MELSNKNTNNFCGIDIRNLTFIGEGRQGRAYYLPKDKVIKVFKSKKSCKNQLFILKHSSNSKFFPKVYDYDNYSIVMEFIKGITLKEYLKSNNLSKNLSLQLVNLINEFEKLGFTRLDIRLNHIYVQPDESVRIIDPRDNFRIIQPFPKLMLKGLFRLNKLNDFFSLIKDDYPDKFSKWQSMWKTYKA
ncbi:serine/threonine protein kinase [Clostridium sp. DJ247]|uniref:serine/threonine protein kinase n=1 Tax=Clostridium sp. DJ247 TaxID=2726188 RepID=UPI0016270D19|nr:serine/threonine protein kinase [Clostridium sp. DJ247]MBC2580751.1 serine/threonine protein kinase [Clostridium sp. DJ247]